jgi:diguanylate cyclase (GGDEF)-like protein
VSIALLLWLGGTIAAVGAQFFEHASPSVAALPDFFYFFYGVPMLLAIASPEDRQSIPVFFWLDGIQAAGVGYLAYVALFGVLPFTGTQPQPISVNRLIWIYDAEDFVLAVFASARLLASPRKSAERRFFAIITVFLWSYAVCASIYNHIEAVKTDAGVFDVLVDVPFLLLTAAVLFAARGFEPEAGRHGRRLSASLIDNARPALLGLCLVAIGAWAARKHFDAAIGIVFCGFVVYGVRSAILQNRFAQTEAALENARDRLEQLVLQDGLTGIPNRRCFDQRFQQEWSRARRTGAPLSVLLIDVDHFKRLNDTFGHMVGDECLIQVAQTLQKALNRPGDLLARYGGEEFVALLPETNDSGAINVAERLQTCLMRTPALEGIDRQVTISIGVTTGVPRAGVTMEHLLQSADRALYTAKQNGRDRTEYLPFPEAPQA